MRTYSLRWCSLLLVTLFPFSSGCASEASAEVTCDDVAGIVRDCGGDEAAELFAQECAATPEIAAGVEAGACVDPSKADGNLYTCLYIATCPVDGVRRTHETSCVGSSFNCQLHMIREGCVVHDQLQCYRHSRR